MDVQQQKGSNHNDFFRRNDSITLEQIKNYIAIYELGSLSLAAKAAYKTQPAISHNISKLEEKLSTKLIKRERGKSISFTEEGHQFYQQVAPALGHLLNQIDEVENKNTISIGICDDLPISVQLAVQQMVTELIDSRVRVICDFSHSIKDMVASGRLSYGIIKLTVDPSEDLQSFGWASNQKVSFDECDKLPIVSAHNGCFVRHIIEDTLNDSGKRYYFSYLASHLQHQVAAIQAGFGIGLLSKDFITRTPNLEFLGADEGFPILPSYQYRLIGEADTHVKQKIEQPLKDFVATIRD